MILKAIDTAFTLWVTRELTQWLLQTPTAIRQYLANVASASLVRHLSRQTRRVTWLATKLVDPGEYRNLIDAYAKRG